MLRKIAGGTGFVLIILGVGGIDSPSLYLPITMIAAGAVLLAAYAGREARWTESESARCGK